jgi:drug/metabolite transporter (DMT)-like permease
MFKRSVDFVTPFALNLFKNSVAFFLLTITALAFRQVHAVVVPPKDLFLILMSGAIGIGVSDTVLFMALGRLGASRTALIDCLYSPFVILFSFFMLNEGLTLSAAIGGVLILSSVVLSSQRSFGEAITRKQFWTGCAFGVLAMATVAFAIILGQPLLHAYPLTWLSAVRMAGGLAALMVSLPFHPDRNSVYKVFAPQRAWRWMIVGTFLGSYLSVVSWVAGFKYSQAGVAALLNQTTTVFIVLFASLFLKEPMNRHKLLAVALAFAGVVIILY